MYIFAGVITIILCYFFIYQNIPKRLYNIDFEDVSIIKIQSGSTGKRIEITNRDEIVKVINDINSFKYKKKYYEILQRVGWSYYVSILNTEGKEICGFLPGFSDIKVDGKFYSVEGNNPFMKKEPDKSGNPIDYKYFDQFFD